MVGVLLSTLTNMEFESKDFEADLVRLCDDVRSLMAPKTMFPL